MSAIRNQAVTVGGAESHSRLVSLDDGESRVLLYPEQGFQLHGFEVGLEGGRRVQAVFGPAAGRSGARDTGGEREPRDRRYGNPVLFPSVGASYGSRRESWEWGGRSLLMPQHGWVRDLYWHVEERDATSLCGVVVPTNAMRAAFPFLFELRLRYSLGRRALTLDADLRNTGPEAFPYALGFHPYLRAPVEDGPREECVVRLPDGMQLQSSDGYRTFARSPFAARTIAACAPELAGSILLAETGSRSLEVTDHAAGVATSVSVDDSERDFPLWVVWSPAPDAPYLCLEPWTDAPNALNRPGTRIIAPGDAHRYRVTIRVRSV